MLRRLSLIVAMLVALFPATRAAVVDTVLVATDHLDTPMKVVVITPDARGEKFPTVYLLNGYTGDYASWTKMRRDLDRLADQYGMVIVNPDGRDSWYWDSRKGMEMESFFVEDLVPYIDSHFPTIPQADKRAISGLSMGGHGAMWLGIRHHDIWGSAASMSGGLDIRPFKTRWKMASLIDPDGTNQQAWETHTAINLIPTLAKGDLNILVDCGVDDFFIEVNRDFHRALLEAGIDHDYIERPGAHTQTYWRNSVLYHLLFFHEVFNK